MKVRNSIFSVCFMFLLVFGLGGCSSQDTGTTNNDVTTQNGKLIYEETISPNKEYVENEEDVVNYTVEIYQDTIKIKISFVNGGIEIIEDALEKK